MVIADRYPVNFGHLLVITRKHYENILEIDDDDLKSVIVLAKRYALLLKERLKPDGIKVLTNTGKAAGQAIMHIHFHIIPFYDEREDKEDLTYHYRMHKALTDDDLNKLKELLLS